MSKEVLVLLNSEINWKSHKQTLQFMDRKHSQWFNEAFFWQSGTYYLSKFAGLPVCETFHLWPGGPFPSFDLLRVSMISLISIKSNGPRLWKSEYSKHIQAHKTFCLWFEIWLWAVGVFWLAVHIYWKWINPSGMINIRDSADSRTDATAVIVILLLSAVPAPLPLFVKIIHMLQKLFSSDVANQSNC